PTTLDWPHRQLIATVTHFSLFVKGGTCVTLHPELCYTDAGDAVISLSDPSGLMTLKVHDDGGGSVFFSDSLGGSFTLGTPRSAMSSLTISAGTADVEIDDNLDGLNGSLTVNAASIKVDTGKTVGASGAIT